MQRSLRRNLPPVAAGCDPRSSPYGVTAFECAHVGTLAIYLA